MMYKLKGYVFIHKGEQVILIPIDNQVEGYEQAHDFFKRSNIPYYMFLLKEVRE